MQQTRSGHLNASSRQITYGNDQALLHQTIQGLHPQGHGNRLRNAFFAARASRPSLLSAFCGFAALQTNLFFSAATANNDHAGAFFGILITVDCVCFETSKRKPVGAFKSHETVREKTQKSEFSNKTVEFSHLRFHTRFASALRGRMENKCFIANYSTTEGSDVSTIVDCEQNLWC